MTHAPGCELSRWGPPPCGARASWVVSVGTRKVDAQRSCARHLSLTCEVMQGAENRAATQRHRVLITLVQDVWLEPAGEPGEADKSSLGHKLARDPIANAALKPTVAVLDVVNHLAPATAFAVFPHIVTALYALLLSPFIRAAGSVPGKECLGIGCTSLTEVRHHQFEQDEDVIAPPDRPAPNDLVAPSGQRVIWLSRAVGGERRQPSHHVFIGHVDRQRPAAAILAMMQAALTFVEASQPRYLHILHLCSVRMQYASRLTHTLIAGGDQQ